MNPKLSKFDILVSGYILTNYAVEVTFSAAKYGNCRILHYQAKPEREVLE